MAKNSILPSSVTPPPSSSGSFVSAASTSQERRSEQTSRPASNRLFLVFIICCAVVSIVNINLHHMFHDEHVHIKAQRDFHAIIKGSAMDKSTNNQQQIEQQSDNGSGSTEHQLAGLKCQEKYGGPDDEFAEREMAFWSDIPSDASYKSPFLDEGEERFLTFEPDHGGWNNIRMGMETALVLAHSMGRTLVLPPPQRFYLLNKDSSQKNSFDFGDFFHLDSIAVEHEGLNVISAEEFLHKLGKTGQLKNINTNRPAIWDEKNHSPQSVKTYLEQVGVNPNWDPMKCVAAFPASKGKDAITMLENAYKNEYKNTKGKPLPELKDFEDNPTPVDATIGERMREAMVDRTEICMYDEALQTAKVIHFPVQKGTRLLTHFYAFVFSADWKQDLWAKRFVRDHLRYIDEIVCAAARVVEAVRARSKNKDKLFDSMHVRRGDFQYKQTRLDADQLIKKSKTQLEEGGLLYIATDEKDKSFFKPFKEHYDIVFLDDFKDLLKGINANYYGMLDQLVAYKGRVFFGTWRSTLSGYINRMRGYYITKHKLEGYKEGTMDSYYFVPTDKRNQMKNYHAVKKPIYMREFPISWRDIDKGIEELNQ